MSSSTCLEKWLTFIDKLERKIGYNITAYAYAFIANIFFAIVDYEIRNSAKIPTFQLIFYRSIAGIVFSYMYVSVLNLPIQFKSTKINKMLIGRSLLGFVNSFFIFYGFQRANLSEAISLFQLAPVFTAVLGVIMLKEKCNIVQGAVTVISILGALLIVKPAAFFESPEEQGDFYDSTRMFGNISVLISTVTYALAIALVKTLAVQKIDPQVSTVYLTVLMCMISALGMIFQGMKTLDVQEIKNVSMICIFNFLATYFNLRALKFGDAGKVVLMSYAEIPFGYILDIMLLGTVVETWSFVGVCLIFSCLFVQVFKKQIIRFFKPETPETKQ